MSKRAAPLSGLAVESLQKRGSALRFVKVPGQRCPDQGFRSHVHVAPGGNEVLRVGKLPPGVGFPRTIRLGENEVPLPTTKHRNLTRSRAPAALTGQFNSLTLAEGTAIQIQNATLTLDKPQTIKARTSAENLEAAIARISAEWKSKGYSELK